ncbi:hypothetical protein K504DRAFT_277400 [Pleomassaria siparia CBS 279.74]|uniref:Uncharacterized protein n=1 Tax=Pleomassaria siparia CBS 279.74 TaxID=1314801 RepID=A0A6G1K9X5_9PLEO|nr:hypothetical protein K504DRAFT_277400 [Pleomassaria siparia CBS 279.74]
MRANDRFPSNTHGLFANHPPPPHPVTFTGCPTLRTSVREPPPAPLSATRRLLSTTSTTTSCHVSAGSPISCPKSTAPTGSAKENPRVSLTTPWAVLDVTWGVGSHDIHIYVPNPAAVAVAAAHARGSALSFSFNASIIVSSHPSLSLPVPVPLIQESLARQASGSVRNTSPAAATPSALFPHALDDTDLLHEEIFDTDARKRLYYIIECYPTWLALTPTPHTAQASHVSRLTVHFVPNASATGARVRISELHCHLSLIGHSASPEVAQHLNEFQHFTEFLLHRLGICPSFASGT